MMALDQISQEEQNLRPETSKCISRQQVRNLNKTSQNFLSEEKRKQIDTVLNEKNTKIENKNKKQGTFASTSIGFYNETNNEYNPNVFQQGMSLEQYLGNGVSFKSIKLVENQKQNRKNDISQSKKIEQIKLSNSNNKVKNTSKDNDNSKNNSVDQKQEQSKENDDRTSLQQYMHLFSSCQSIPFQGNNKHQESKGKYSYHNNSYDQENHVENDLFQKIEGFEINETDEDNFSESDTNQDTSLNNIINNNSTNSNIQNEGIRNNLSRSIKNHNKNMQNNSSSLNVDKQIGKRESQNSQKKGNINDIFQADNQLFCDQMNKENLRSTNNSNYKKNDFQIEQSTKSKEKKSQIRQSINSIKNMRENQQSQQNKEKIFNKGIQGQDQKEFRSPNPKQKNIQENSLRDAQISQKIRDKYSKNAKKKSFNIIITQRSNQLTEYQQQLINKFMNGSQKSFYGNSQNFNYNINNINNQNAIDMYEENIMRRTLKENKFLNQKDRIQDMQLQDQKFLTKHAARFGLNQEDCK
ncbi:hypothetical protein PPERSA_10918 [Pseudocohnilembus persalinus]|uniref:Uncharacterized protein n=1 Tax=Pseudocohnilembus persalinus TaxID=266149 RepID=A0A0V0R9H7_PSEPJ|nr:hypothetical protein PPERSA_10918 [Pseudocohnilembus persalinus]|eukprot:KRX11151.1 hypothetical protein PPERSA_10918 [Pseudocohnilembus persalinus]